MHTIFLNGSDYTTARELHEDIQLLLRLPERYGHNADALHDCLTERRETVNLVVRGHLSGEAEAAFSRCAAVIRDLGGTVTHL